MDGQTLQTLDWPLLMRTNRRFMLILTQQNTNRKELESQNWKLFKKLFASHTTDRASTTVFALKKNRKLRFCIDYRRLKVMSIRKNLSCSMINACNGVFEDAIVLSTLDANVGYLKVKHDERDKKKTAFVTPHGLNIYTRTPFDLAKALATFEWMLHVMPAPMQLQSCNLYLK